MDTEKNITPDTDDTNEAGSFKAKRDQWESEWKAEFKRDWEKSWKGEWKKHNRKHHNRPSAAIKLEMGDGQTYSLSVGKIILAVVFLMILPFQLVLVGGAIWAAYHFGRRSVENDSDETSKSKHDQATAA